MFSPTSDRYMGIARRLSQLPRAPRGKASDKSDVHDLAAQLLEAGYAVATPNYDLCAPATLPVIVEQMRRFMLHLHAHAASLGIDQNHFNIAGTWCLLEACRRSPISRNPRLLHRRQGNHHSQATSS